MAGGASGERRGILFSLALAMKEIRKDIGFVAQDSLLSLATVCMIGSAHLGRCARCVCSIFTGSELLALVP